MAEDKDKSTNLMSSDFLDDIGKGIGSSGLFDKLGALAQYDAMRPIIQQEAKSLAFKPLTEKINQVQDARKALMTAYIAANPGLDESMMHEGVADEISGQLTSNNERYRELAKKITLMSPNNPEYAGVVREMEQIMQSGTNFKADNEKLLSIRNVMKDEDRVEELSAGQSDAKQEMFQDILVGNKENFKVIDGKLHWVNPNAEEGEEPIAVDSIDAGGPLYESSEAQVAHIELYDQVIKADYINDKVLSHKVKTMMKGIGNDGLKSLIFDSQNDENEMFNTTEWFDTWYNSQGVTRDKYESDQEFEDAKEAEYNRIRNGGVTTTGETGNVKQHFQAWYHSKLKEDLGTEAKEVRRIEEEISGGGLDVFTDDEEDGDGGSGDTSVGNDYGVPFTEIMDQREKEYGTLQLLETQYPSIKGMLDQADIFDARKLKIEKYSKLDIVTDGVFDFIKTKMSSNDSKIQKKANRRFDLTNERSTNRLRNQLAIYDIAKSKEEPTWLEGVNGYEEWKEKHGEWNKMSTRKKSELVYRLWSSLIPGKEAGKLTQWNGDVWSELGSGEIKM